MSKMSSNGRSWISQRGAPEGECSNLLFGKMFIENCMEIKEIGRRDWGVKQVTLSIARGRQVDDATHHRSRLLVL